MALSISAVSLQGFRPTSWTREAGPVGPVRPVPPVIPGTEQPDPNQGPATVVSISAAARALAGSGPAGTETKSGTSKPGDIKTESVADQADKEKLPGQSQADKKGSAKSAVKGSGELSDDEKRQVDALKQRDREVHAHEQAHQAQGAGLAGGASYSYEQGPDGQRYAVAGSVPIDASSVPNDPEATVSKMETVRRAALAPADPSGPDLQIAARATQTEQKAQAQLAQKRYSDVQQLGSGTKSQSRAQVA